MKGMYWGRASAPTMIEPGSNIKEEKVEPLGYDKEPYIEIVDNHIYFYSDIERDKILQLNRHIREAANKFMVEAKQREQEFLTPIYLHIYSYGGSVHAGLSAMDEIQACKVPVYTIVDGCCASAATFLSLAGKKRFIKKRSTMLIHQLSSTMWGKYTEFQDKMKNLDMVMKIIKDVYAKYTKVPVSEIDEILKHDLWWESEKCLELGLVDEIIS